MRFGLTEETIVKINSVFAKYSSVEQVIIYGSRAKGNYKNGSDIDLTMIGKSITDKEQSEIWLELDDLPIPYMIDLSIKSHIDNLDLINHIDRVGQIFYERAKTR